MASTRGGSMAPRNDRRYLRLGFIGTENSRVAPSHPQYNND
jgi:hypothetical protein